MGGVVADGDRASLEPTLNEFAETMGKAMGSFEELKLQKIFKGLLTAEKKLLSLVDDLKAVSYSEELRTGLSKYAEEVKAMPFVWVKKITPTSSLEAKLSAISILEEEIKPIYEGMREARRRIGKAPKSSDGEKD
eukprot:s2134_g3.t2